MKRMMILLCLCLGGDGISVAQTVQNKQQEVEKYEKMFKQLEAESRTYYANADTAAYGVRYLWSYVFDKPHKRVYRENRILIVASESTVDRSYQSMGERAWMKTHYKDKVMGNDSTLAGRLTPSFYFYRPEQKRLQRTYRIVSEEFLLQDTVVENRWDILKEKKNIGGFRCQKAVCRIGGRVWHAWFTRDLPYSGGPRHLTGLPGVVLEVSDEEGEISWEFQGVIKNDAGAPLFVKYPDKISEIPLSRFSVIRRLYALSDRSNVQRSGVIGHSPCMLPEIFLPSTGIDAYNVSNPIERE